MAQRGVVSRALIAAIAGAALTGATRADDDAPARQRRILDKMTEGAAQHPCMLPNCATVVAVHHRERWEPSGPISAPGISRNPPFGPYDPLLPRITQPSSSVQQRKEVWIIEVRRRDGTVEVFRQGYPALFQVGEEVLVEGDRIQAWD